MRIAKAHQQPYHGFAWDHPLRKQFREKGYNHDPIVSEHKVYYIFRDPFFWFMCFLGLVCTIMLTVGSFRQGIATTTLFLSIPISGILMVVTLLLGAFLGVFAKSKDTEMAFDVRVKELAEALGISPELVAVPWGQLCRLADAKLVDQALTVLEIEKATALCPFDPARSEAKQAFEKAYRLFKQRKLIEDTGYTTYFDRAAKR